MTNHKLYQQFYTLLLLFNFNSSCNGQNQKLLPKENKTVINFRDKTLVHRSKDAAYGPSDIVQCMVKDKDGNLWFGITGGNGVFRYDGKVFTPFTTQDGLFNNHVGSILEDKNGNIRFGTEGGVCRYDGQSFNYFKSL